MSWIKNTATKIKGAGDTAQGWVNNQRKQAQGNSGVMKALAEGYGRISGQNYDYLIGDEYKFQGTVNAGGISYSGADIKVVVNRYYTEDAKKISDQYQEAMKKHDKDEKDLLKEKLQLIDDIAVAKRDTPEEINLKKQYIKNNKALDQNDRMRQSSGEAYSASVKDLHSKPATMVLAEAQTLSISSFRDKAPVRSLGSVYPKGYTRGPRQIGGSLVFTVFDRDVLFNFLEVNPTDFDGNRNTSAVLDQIPPVDIIISFASELGSVSQMAIYGVEFVSQGQIMSIEDIITENTVEYVARDFDPMSNIGVANFKESVGRTIKWQSQSASDLIYQADQRATKVHVDPFERYKRRNIPFL